MDDNKQTSVNENEDPSLDLTLGEGLTHDQPSTSDQLKDHQGNQRENDNDNDCAPLPPLPLMGPAADNNVDAQPPTSPSHVEPAGGGDAADGKKGYEPTESVGLSEGYGTMGAEKQGSPGSNALLEEDTEQGQVGETNQNLMEQLREDNNNLRQDIARLRSELENQRNITEQMGADIHQLIARFDAQLLPRGEMGEDLEEENKVLKEEKEVLIKKIKELEKELASVKKTAAAERGTAQDAAAAAQQEAAALEDNAAQWEAAAQREAAARAPARQEASSLQTPTPAPQHQHPNSDPRPFYTGRRINNPRPRTPVITEEVKGGSLR